MRVFVADTRGESFSIGTSLDELRQYRQSHLIWEKETLDHARNANPTIDVSNLSGAIAVLLESNPTSDFRRVILQLADHIRNNDATIFSGERIGPASTRLREALFQWLDRQRIAYHKTAPIHIAATVLTTELAEFKDQNDCWFAPDIPRHKEANARDKIRVPEDETVTLLIDCTFWGSATDAVLIGKRGVYFHNSGIEGFLPYSAFPHRTFNETLNPSRVSIGTDQLINLEGSQFTGKEMVRMLDKLKAQAVRQSSRTNSADGETLQSLAGMHELKQMLQQDVVEPFKNPEKFRRYGLSIPNGVLLYGPPGCGKTYVAQRLSKELGCNFIDVSPASLGSPYIHQTVLYIKALFEDAAKSAPALVFVDEFEGLVSSRRILGPEQTYKAEEVNEWLIQIARCAERRILFVAATNEPWKIDEAVRRTGRLDKKVYVGPPDALAIREILNLHLRKRPLRSLQEIASFSEEIAGQGYASSDLKAISDEAARLAMQEDTDISLSHLRRTAATRVRPSISRETIEEHLEFGN